MALPALTPPQKRVFTPHNKCCFQLSIHMRNLHLWHIKRKNTITGEMNNCIGKCRHEKQSLLPTESPGEREYASTS